MIREKKYPDNNAWAGLTAIMYNVHLDLFFNSDGSIKSEFSGRVSDVGFEWKETSSQNWTTVSLVENPQSNISIQQITDVNDGSENFTPLSGNYMCQRWPYSYGKESFEIYGKKDYYLYPTRVLIKNLTKNTSYDLKSYYTISGVKTEYNSQTITTMDGEPCQITLETDFTNANPELVTEEIKNRATQDMIEKQSIINEMFGMFYKKFWVSSEPSKFIVKLEAPWAGVAAMSGDFRGGTMYIDPVYYRAYDNFARTILIHELGHAFMYSQYGNLYIENNVDFREEVIKFMEFATNVPHAMWVWMGYHNYPVISSAGYSYMDDLLCIAAYYLSQKAYNVQ